MRLGEAIRTARVERGLSQSALGKHFGISKAAVGQWESGKNYPDLRKLPELVRFLGLDPALVIGLPEMSSIKNDSHTIATTRVDTSTIALIPLYDVRLMSDRVGSGEGLQLLRTDDRISAPADLRLAKDSFAIRYWDDDLAPWVRRGAALFVNTSQKAREGDWALFYKSADPEAGIIQNPRVGLLLARKGNSYAVQIGMARIALALADWPLSWLIEWIKP